MGLHPKNQDGCLNPEEFRRRIDKAWLQDRTRISGRAKVSPDVVIEDDARIGGYAVVHGGTFKGRARIGGFAKIYGGTWDGTEGPVYEGEWYAPGQPANPGKLGLLPSNGSSLYGWGRDHTEDPRGRPTTIGLAD